MFRGEPMLAAQARYFTMESTIGRGNPFGSLWARYVAETAPRFYLLLFCTKAQLGNCFA